MPVIKGKEPTLAELRSLAELAFGEIDTDDIALHRSMKGWVVQCLVNEEEQVRVRGQTKRLALRKLEAALHAIANVK